MSSKRHEDVVRDLCAHVQEGDGDDPRRAGRESNNQARERRARQLCAQVARALNQALAGLADDALRGCTVSAVVPAPDAGRLRVTLRAPEPKAAEARLAHARGLLRLAAGDAISRKRVPELMFVTLGEEAPDA